MCFRGLHRFRWPQPNPSPIHRNWIGPARNYFLADHPLLRPFCLTFVLRFFLNKAALIFSLSFLIFDAGKSFRWLVAVVSIGIYTFQYGFRIEDTISVATIVATKHTIPSDWAVRSTHHPPNPYNIATPFVFWRAYCAISIIRSPMACSNSSIAHPTRS